MSAVIPKNLEKLKGVNAKLQDVILAVYAQRPDFSVTEGLRTKARQAELVAAGKSQTMKSRHLVGQAVDLVIFKGARPTWDLAEYRELNQAIQAEAAKQGVLITWGGSWKTLVDGVHWQIEPDLHRGPL